MKKIWVENSTWSNIGDGFYQSSLLYQIERLFPDAIVYHGEGPLDRTFGPSKLLKKNGFDLIDHQVADVYVFSGPMLRQLTWRYRETIEKILDAGRQYAIFSCSAADASPTEIREIRAFFTKYPPLGVGFRDSEHFDELADAVPMAFSGICAAFLAREMPIANVELDQEYIISNFYSVREPRMSYKNSIYDINLEFRKEFTLLPRKYSRHFDWIFASPQVVGNYRILRVRHEPLMKLSHMYFRDANSFCGMNPYSLLSVYKGAKMVVSDRVHACVAGLAMGAAARLIRVDRRSSLFEQCAIVDRDKHDNMTLNVENYSVERRRLQNFIQRVLG